MAQTPQDLPGAFATAVIGDCHVGTSRFLAGNLLDWLYTDENSRVGRIWY